MGAPASTYLCRVQITPLGSLAVLQAACRSNEDFIWQKDKAPTGARVVARERPRLAFCWWITAHRLFPAVLEHTQWLGLEKLVPHIHMLTWLFCFCVRLLVGAACVGQALKHAGFENGSFNFGSLTLSQWHMGPNAVGFHNHPEPHYCESKVK